MYNPLTILSRRIKRYMVTVFVTVGMTLFTLGMSFLVIAHDNSSVLFLILGACLGSGGLFCLEEGIRRAKDEDTKKNNQIETLIQELKDFHKDLKKS